MEKRKPSGYYYLIPILSIVIGIVLMIVFALRDFSHTSLDQAFFIKDVKNHAIISIEEEGKYYILIEDFYFEQQKSTVLNKKLIIDLIGTEDITVSLLKDGETVQIYKMPSNFNLNINGYSAIAYIEVDPNDIGDYTVDTSTDDVELKLSNGSVGKMFFFIFKYILVILMSGLVAFISFVIILVKRSTYKKRNVNHSY